MSIYTDQKIPLETTFTDKDGAVDLTGATVRYNYWYAGNETETPDGSVSGTITDAVNGKAEGEITAAENTTPGYFSIQGVATIAGDEWPEVVTRFKILERGQKY